MELPWPSIKSACCVKECCPVFRSLPRCPLKNVPQSIKMKEIKKILQKAIAPAESTRYTETVSYTHLNISTEFIVK